MQFAMCRICKHVRIAAQCAAIRTCAAQYALSIYARLYLRAHFQYLCEGVLPSPSQVPKSSVFCVSHSAVTKTVKCTGCTPRSRNEFVVLRLLHILPSSIVHIICFGGLSDSGHVVDSVPSVYLVADRRKAHLIL